MNRLDHKSIKILRNASPSQCLLWFFQFRKFRNTYNYITLGQKHDIHKTSSKTHRVTGSIYCIGLLSLWEPPVLLEAWYAPGTCATSATRSGGKRPRFFGKMQPRFWDICLETVKTHCKRQSTWCFFVNIIFFEINCLRLQRLCQERLKLEVKVILSFWSKRT